jgi:putative ABC transport system substrate-binding protein
LPIPIVHIFSGDPTAAGLADSLSRPRGNMTGLGRRAKTASGWTSCATSFQGCAVLLSSPTRNQGVNLERANSEEIGQRLGIEIRYYPTPSLAQLEAALVAIKDDPVQAISIFSDGFAVQNRKVIFDSAAAQRIPVIAAWSVFARSGAICSYGPLQSEQYRRLAAYVDRIMKGAKPSELPIQQPTKFETVVNLRTAKALGLYIPPTLLASADEIID